MKNFLNNQNKDFSALKLYNDKEVKWNWPSSVAWLIIWGAIIAFALGEFLDWGWSYHESYQTFVLGGAGGYFFGKAKTDGKKVTALKDSKEIKTTLGLKPRSARFIMAVTIVVIYMIFFIARIRDDGTFTLELQDQKDFIRPFFTLVITYYLPNFIPSGETNQEPGKSIHEPKS